MHEAGDRGARTQMYGGYVTSQADTGEVAAELYGKGGRVEKEEKARLLWLHGRERTWSVTGEIRRDTS
jgi:hypothetical protein